MICELCGSQAPFLKDVIVERSRLMVCPGCAKMGKRFTEEKKDIPSTLIEERLQRREQRMKTRDIYQNMSESLAEDYPERIMKARKKKGLSRDEMGMMIKVKANIIGKLENGTLHPDDALRKKIERFLNINLLTTTTTGIINKSTQKKGMTLGDFIVVKESKKK